MKINILYCLSLYFILPNLNATNIAITFDDFPMPNGALFTVKERTQRYVDALAEHNAKAAFFCVGQHCKNRNDSSLFKTLHANGQFIANHSMSHPRTSSLSLQDFETEITTNDQLLSSYGIVQKWFMYPYLDYGHVVTIGGSMGKVMDFLSVLNKLGYKEGYSTVKNFDWQLNKRLQETVKKKKSIDPDFAKAEFIPSTVEGTDTYDKLKTIYLDLLKEWITYFVDLYKNNISQEIIHTINFQDDDLNALYLGDILKMLKESGFNIVSPEIAYNDLSWRSEILKNEELLANKPASLNCDYIDSKLVDLGMMGT